MAEVVLPPLWPHQRAAITAVELALAAGGDRGLIVLPTGCGKTGMVLSLGRRLAAPMLFLVHRDELLQQTVAAAGRFWPEAHVAVLAAETDCRDEPDLVGGRRPDLVAAMVPTLVRRLSRIDPERFGIVVADEAHLSAAPTWTRVLDHFRPGFRLGVTATPQRLDGKGLAVHYGREPLYSYSLHQAIEDGRLCPIRSEAVQTDADLDAVRAEGEDGEEELNARQVALTVNTLTRNALVVEAYLRCARDRRAVAFCVDVEHTVTLAAAFQAQGVRCEAVPGGRPEQRRAALRAFAAGELDVLTNCEVLTTGFDDPGISCLLMARPTLSRGLYQQMVGRGLRLAPDKNDCLVIDFTDNCKRHKLASVLDLVGRRKPGSEVGEQGPKARQQKQARALLSGLAALPPVSWRLETVCPWPELPSLNGYVPTLGWHNEPATEAQCNALARFGLAAAAGLSKGEASWLLDRAAEFEAAFPISATAKQRWLLEQHGLWAEGMGKRQASVLISQLKGASQKTKHRKVQHEEGRTGAPDRAAVGPGAVARLADP